MKTVKKFIAACTAAFFVIRFLVFNTFAYAPAVPVLVGSEFSEILVGILVSTGLYSSTELLGQSNEELSNKLHAILSSDTLPTDSPDVMQNLQNSFVNLVTSPAANITGKVVQMKVDEVLNNFFSDYEALNNAVDDSPMVDLKGYGALVKAYDENGNSITVFCDYVVKTGDESYQVYGNGAYYWSDNGYSGTSYYGGTRIKVGVGSQIGYNVHSIVYASGDVRYPDGSQAPTNDEDTGAVLGYVNGVAVTPDMLNPDGSVTIDGVTYFPEDYIDWSKLRDEAILDLLNKILSALDTLPELEDEEALADELAEELDVELDIAELNDLMLPSGILTVFPFCLPFDFVRGLRLLSTPPVAPKFEIPFNLPSFGLFEGSQNIITFDMSEYSKYFEVGRWIQVVIFMIGICFISFKIVKGVH